jgi:hypothetical protein
MVAEHGPAGRIEAGRELPIRHSGQVLRTSIVGQSPLAVAVGRNARPLVIRSLIRCERE